MCSSDLQEDSAALDRLYVRATSGQMVPLSALTRYESSVAPLTINHQDQFPSVTLSFNLAPGHSLGEAVAAIQAMERSLARPAGLTSHFEGSAKRSMRSRKRRKSSGCPRA